MAKKPSDSDESIQETPQGYEIPVPKKRDVLADLEKVAKPSRPRRSKKKR